MKNVYPATVVFDPIDINSNHREIPYLIVDCDGVSLIYEIKQLDVVSEWKTRENAYCEVNRLIDKERYAIHFGS